MDEFDDALNSAAFDVAEPLPSEDSSAWLSGLNDGQSLAVSQLDGAVLVLAGAGTGKTKVLTTRLAELVHHRKARAYEILCVTFTNKAANEMRGRVNSLIGSDSGNIWLGTFHSIAAKILRRHADLVGLHSDFTILDSDDQHRLIKRIVDEDSISIDLKRFPPRLVNHLIQRWKDRGESCEDISVGGIPKDDMSGIPYDKIVRIYVLYQERLKLLNAVDFGDLLLYNLEIFKRHGDILREYQDRFHYILVDEYQDTNVSQYLWLRLLSQFRKNICCVGDDDQSIYGWRGAEVGNILKFEKDFPDATIVRLERNYRSTSHILSAASGLISVNRHRLGKTLWTEGNDGEKVRVIGFWDSGKEARHVVSEISKISSNGVDYGSVAILVRAGFMTREFEEKLLKFGIPYRIVGGAKFYDREEIRDGIAYLRLVANLSDNLAFERIVNKPTRGIGSGLLEVITDFGRSHGLGYFESCERLCVSDVIKSGQSAKLLFFVDMVRKWRGLLSEGGEGAAFPAHILAEQVLHESGYFDMWRGKQATDPQAEGRVENLHEMILAMKDFESLEQFLEHVALVSERDIRDEVSMVSLMTLHASKGLEFSHIYLPCWEEGLFPNQRSMDESGLTGLEEERRLAYVGLTRAKERICITYSASRFVHGSWVNSLPSRFIDELPSIDVEYFRGDDSGGVISVDHSDVHVASGGFGGNGFSASVSPRSGSGGVSHIWNSGDSCRHVKFGVGVIIDGGDGIVVVEFADGSERKISGDFLEFV